MKNILLLIATICVSQITLAQNWQQQGQPQFTNFVSDAAITHNSAGETFVVFADVFNANNLTVQKFDGTNWVTIGATQATSVGGEFLGITIQPKTQNPWVVFKNTITNNIEVTMFDSTSWINQGSIAVTPRENIQIKVDSNDNAFIAAIGTGTLTQTLYFYSNRSGAWQAQFTKIVTGFPDLISTDTIYYSERDWPTGIDIYRRTFNGSAWTAEVLIKDALNISTFSENLFVIDENHPLIKVNSNVSEIVNGSPSYSSTLIGSNATGLYSNYKKSSYKNLNYLFYQTSADKVEVRTKGTTGGPWPTLPDAGIDMSALANGAFAKMSLNPVTGQPHILYNDAGMLSVRYYTAPPELKRVYVDKDAIGLADGTSWANAYTSIKNAMQVGVGDSTEEVWVAEGVYIIDSVNTNSPILIKKNNLRLLGGFNGTELFDTLRNPSLNETIFEGDILGNDAGDNNPTSSLRLDNSSQFILVIADGLLIDGFTFRGAANQATINVTASGAITVSSAVTNLTISNVNFVLNSSRTGGAGITFEANSSASINIYNCSFNGNRSSFGSAIYLTSSSANSVVNATVSNSLFVNNEARSVAFGSARSGAAGWFRALNGSALTVNLINDTYADNSDAQGTTGDKGAVGIGEDATSTCIAKVQNCIFWGNYVGTSSRTVSKAISPVTDNIPSTLIVQNSLSELGFTNIVVKQNTFNADPKFVSSSDFSLRPSSPALNVGDSSYLATSVNLDLAGNDRIYGTNIDLGAFEYNSDLLPRVYVSKSATGANNGSSWTDAFTNIPTALIYGMSNSTTEMWIAGGTYLADTSDRNVSLNFNADNVSYYGGFAGTETSLNQRNISANQTYISGDIDGNDPLPITRSSVNRIDNSSKLAQISGDSCTFDGIAFNGAHSFIYNTTNNNGAAVIIDSLVTDISFNQCLFEFNFNSAAGASIYFEMSNSTSVRLNKCYFNQNIGLEASSFQFKTISDNITANVSITNSIFYGGFVTNMIINNFIRRATAGSGGWIETNQANATVNVDFINNTYAYNADAGSQLGNVQGVVILSENTGTVNANLYNNIFWYNRGQINLGGPASKAIAEGTGNLPVNITADRNLDEDNFSNISGATNTLSSDPLFVLGSLQFDLQSASPAIDAGNNSLLPASFTTDILDSARINGGTIDLGANEYYIPMTTFLNTIENRNESISIYPNPALNYISISSEDRIKFISIFNLQGKLVKTVREGFSRIDLSSLPKGIYMATIETRNIIKTSKLVVQ